MTEENKDFKHKRTVESIESEADMLESMMSTEEFPPEEKEKVLKELGYNQPHMKPVKEFFDD